MKKLSLLLTAVLLLTSCGGTSTDSDTIKIGFISPLSGDGATYGTTIRNITEMWLDDINSSGGINGRSVEVIYEDGQCVPASAAKAAHKLIDLNHVSIILGGACSGETLAVAPLAETAQTILISSLSSHADISSAGDYIFRTVPSDVEQSQKLADYATTQGYQRVALLVEQTDYPVGLADRFEASFSGQVIRKEFLSSETDFRTILTSLSAQSPDVLVLLGQTVARSQVVFRQLIEMGWSTPLMTDANNLGLLDFFRDNTTFFTDRLAAAVTFPPTSEQFQQFTERYATTYGEPLQHPEYATFTRDALEAIERALYEVGDDPEAIKQYWYAHQFTSPSGYQFSFDANGDFVGPGFSIARFDGTDFIPLTN